MCVDHEDGVLDLMSNWGRQKSASKKDVNVPPTKREQVGDVQIGKQSVSMQSSQQEELLCP